ncbi:MAG: DNA replication/repair protein RecF [Anaerolineae bacterium]
MYIQRLSLTNYRNYHAMKLNFSPGCVVVQGGNAQGKTNLLEAVYYLATAGTPHALSDRQLINWEVHPSTPDQVMLIPYARLEGDFVTDGEQKRIEMILTINAIQAGDVDRLQKTIKVDGVNRRVTDLAGLVNVVLFSPTDTELVAGSPGVRRRYLDHLLSQLDPRYARALARYNRIMSQRNHLLRRLRDEGGDPAELVFWGDQLVQHGAVIVAYRLRAIDRLNERAGAIHTDLTGGDETLALGYASSVLKGPAAEMVLQSSLDRPDQPPALSRERIEDVFRARLAQREPAERARGVTLVGPHRADITMTVNDIDMGVYSSRGQQRTIALTLRLAQAELIRTVTGAPPILLLDDVMSELDAERRQYLMVVAQRHEQAFLTSTDLADFSEAFLAQARVLHVENGVVQEVPSEVRSLS